MKKLLGLILGLFLCLKPGPAHAATAGDILEDGVKDAIFSTVNGTIYYQVEVKTIAGLNDLELSYNNTDQDSLPSASTIKVYIGLTLADMVENGEISYTEDIKKDLDLALRYSDNEATNRLIDRIGFERVNSYIENLTGEKRTRLNRKMLARGKENTANPKDLRMAIVEVYKRGDPVIKDMADSLENPSTKKSKLLKELPDYAYSLNKTGELIGIENDLALIDLGENVFVISLLTKNDDYVSKEEQIRLINDLGAKVIKVYEDYELNIKTEKANNEESIKEKLTNIDQKTAYSVFNSLISKEAAELVIKNGLDLANASMLKDLNSKASLLTARALSYLESVTDDNLLTKDDQIVNLMRLIYTDEDSIEDLDHRLCMAIFRNKVSTSAARLVLEKAPILSLDYRDSLIGLINKSEEALDRARSYNLKGIKNDFDS